MEVKTRIERAVEELVDAILEKIENETIDSNISHCGVFPSREDSVPNHYIPAIGDATPFTAISTTTDWGTDREIMQLGEACYRFKYRGDGNGKL